MFVCQLGVASASFAFQAREARFALRHVLPIEDKIWSVNSVDSTDHANLSDFDRFPSNSLELKLLESNNYPTNCTNRQLAADT